MRQRAFDDVEFLENSRKSRHCKSDRVIQEELRGVDNPRILNRLQHAVNRTNDNTFLMPNIYENSISGSIDARVTEPPCGNAKNFT